MSKKTLIERWAQYRIKYNAGDDAFAELYCIAEDAMEALSKLMPDITATGDLTVTGTSSNEEELVSLLDACIDHLDYCGYGDAYEYECAKDSGLIGRVNKYQEGSVSDGI